MQESALMLVGSVNTSTNAKLFIDQELTKTACSILALRCDLIWSNLPKKYALSLFSISTSPDFSCEFSSQQSLRK